MKQPFNFCVLRLQKIKSVTSLRRSFKHSFREQNTPNAEKEKLKENINLAASNSNEAIELFKKRLPLKLRKNGVLAVEHVITASPDFFAGKTKVEINKYFSESIAFFNRYWGGKNVISANVHYDEKTPHMHLFVCPVDEKTGRLNCRKWLGERNSLSELQSSFYDEVGSKQGLKRGVKGSKANNRKLRDFYKNINIIESLKDFEIPSKSDFLKASMGRSSDSINKLINLANATHEASLKIDELKREKRSLLKFISKNEKDKDLVSELENKLSHVRQELGEVLEKGKEQNTELTRLRNSIIKQKSSAKSNTESSEDEMLQDEIEEINKYDIH